MTSAVDQLTTHLNASNAITDDPINDDDGKTDNKTNDNDEKEEKMNRKYKVYCGIDFGTDGCTISYGLNDGSVFIHNRWKDICAANEKPETSILFDDKGNAKAYGSKAKQTYIDLNNVQNWMLFEKYKMALYTDPSWRSQIKSTKSPAKRVDIHDYIISTNNPSLKYKTSAIFVTQLKYLYKCAMEFMFQEFKQKRRIKFKKAEIQWILTVPAIWSDSAKDKMKKWSKIAGLINNNSYDDQLKIVYEPDCASLSIQYALIRSIKSFNNNNINPNNTDNNDIIKAHRPQISVTSSFNVSDKYLLLDVGGGTADVACHRIISSFSIEELLHPSGGKWGAQYIDNEFIKLLENIFTPEWMNQFINKQLNNSMYHQLISNFVNDAKKTFYDYGKLKRDSHHVSIPRNFIEFLITKLSPNSINANAITQQTSNSVDFDTVFDDFDNDNNDDNINDNDNDKKDDIEYLHEYLRNQSVSLYNDINAIKLQIHQYCTYSLSFCNKIWFNMFDIIINPIIGHCCAILNNPIMKDTKYMFLVGGLANSKYYQKRIKDVFHTTPYNVRVVIPELPQLCVVDGAARYGIQPSFMKIRKLSLTYGIAAARKLSVLDTSSFPPGYIDCNKYYSDVSKQTIIRGCFYKFAEKNKSISLNDAPITKTFSKLSSNSNKINITIYTSSKLNPVTINKNESKSIAQFILDFNETDDTKLIVEFNYSDTTLKVSAYPENKPNLKKEIPINYY